MKQIAVDLFCGAGGTSTGLLSASKELGIDIELIAINHWNIAIETHSSNHSNVRHLCESIDNLDPRKLVPGGRVKLLVASPECTHHSIARGGKPRSEQSRASAWNIIRWAEALYIENILIENVKEFRSWGPLGANGQPLRSMRGKTYLAFLEALRSIGYTVDDRVINTANYGDPTTRERLFIMARRGTKKIKWPEITHSRGALKDLFADLKQWVPAKEIIDWSIEGKSIFGRKKPLANNTLRRILSGLEKFCSKDLKPFLVKLYNTTNSQSVEEPIPTVTAGGNHLGLCEPFIVNMKGKSRSRSVNDPIHTQTTKNHQYLCQPFIVGIGQTGGNGSRTRSVEQPLSTVVTKQEFALCEPFVIGQQSGASPRSVKKPLPTIATAGAISLVEPFIIPYFGERKGQRPRTHSVNQPLPTITGQGAGALIEPYIVNYNRTGKAHSVKKPLPTISTKDRFGLAMPEVDGMKLDIKFRMLQPHELAKAMSFPENYKFSGNRNDIVKQIGNAVPVKTAMALTKELLR